VLSSQRSDVFDSVLIANRGEIAVRVIRACRELGVKAAAVYSDADAGAYHVRLAGSAQRLGPAPAEKSYLDIGAVVAAARELDAEAVHPGYGLLSENAAFARAVSDAGLGFVGPSPATIATMGDKVAARAAAESSGVPVLPASGLLSHESSAGEAADGVGYPLLVKAAFGGGGRGMRVVSEPGELAAAVGSAAREARAAFGREEVYLEHYLPRPRHVEVQLLADSHGTVLTLGDRDCSVQRRHQKLLEEAPAPALPAELRTRLARAAAALARGTGYVGAGTVEFLLAPETGEFFFLEMNTRLQVEHGVTELVTGIDLVTWQLRVAAGEPLGIRQEDVAVRGHAIQARLAAEDPWADFRPCPGPVAGLHIPGGPGIRADFGVAAGDAVPPDYDSLFGKLHAWAGDRDSARRRLAGALEELDVRGIAHTGPYLGSVLAEPAFADARHDTGSLERDWWPDHANAPQPPEEPQTGTSTEIGAVREVMLHTDRGALTVAVYGAVPGGRAGTSGQAGSPGTLQESPGAARAEPVAPMDATVITVAAAEGTRVAAGETLAVVEAMKMEMPITAPRAGTVRRVKVTAGDTVSAGDLLIELGGDDDD
jgi:acetyl-CoA/propionyl-CoA carboxylase biotin carboxyl carrier protein